LEFGKIIFTAIPAIVNRRGEKINGKNS